MKLALVLTAEAAVVRHTVVEEAAEAVDSAAEADREGTKSRLPIII